MKPYLVTEVPEGRTLRERLREGPLPFREAIDVALQAANALAAMHERGSVRGDLKPEEVFLAADGRVRIVDVGRSDTDAPAVTPAVEGAGYLAPEQIRGEAADARSDVFALGAILYEMVTGATSFPGETPVERKEAVLNADPPPLESSAVPVPPGLARVLRRCLEKAPEERFQLARDLAFALEAITEDSGSAAPLPGDGPRPNRVRKAWAAAAAVASLATAPGGARASAPGAAAEPAAQPAPAAPKYTRLTFRSGVITGAAFTPEPRTIVFSGFFEGDLPRVFQGIIGSPHFRAVTQPNTTLFDVSPTGDITFGIVATGIPHEFTGGVLARVALSGGAPRELADGVKSGVYAPDGRLLITRREGANHRVEFHPGPVLLETSDVIWETRVSPSGDLVALDRYPKPDDDRGFVQIIDTSGRQVARSREQWSLGGIAWHPSGEVWFTASDSGSDRSLRALSRDGAEREILRVPGSLLLLDVDADGRALLAVGTFRLRLHGRIAGDEFERPLSWFDGSIPSDLSADGRTLLFSEGRGAGAAESQVFLRRAGGEEPVLLGQGYGRALSPDGRWAAISPTFPFHTLSLVPTGPGSPRELPMGDFESLGLVRFFRDGTRLAMSAQQDGRQRIFVQPIGGEGVGAEAPQATGVDDLVMTAGPSPDGRCVAAIRVAEGPVPRPAGGPVLLDVVTGAVTPLAGLDANAQPTQWSEDGRELIVVRRRPPPDAFRMDVLRYDVATGASRPLMTLGSTDNVGTTPPRRWVFTPDARQYVYQSNQKLDTLYLVEGLR